MGLIPFLSPISIVYQNDWGTACNFAAGPKPNGRLTESTYPTNKTAFNAEKHSVNLCAQFRRRHGGLHQSSHRFRRDGRHLCDGHSRHHHWRIFDVYRDGRYGLHSLLFVWRREHAPPPSDGRAAVSRLARVVYPLLPRRHVVLLLTYPSETVGQT